MSFLTDMTSKSSTMMSPLWLRVWLCLVMTRASVLDHHGRFTWRPSLLFLAVNREAAAAFTSLRSRPRRRHSIHVHGRSPRAGRCKTLWLTMWWQRLRFDQWVGHLMIALRLPSSTSSRRMMNPDKKKVLFYPSPATGLCMCQWHERWFVVRWRGFVTLGFSGHEWVVLDQAGGSMVRFQRRLWHVDMQGLHRSKVVNTFDSPLGPRTFTNCRSFFIGTLVSELSQLHVP